MYLVVELNTKVSNMDIENLEFASLLHDIGKLYLRTGESSDINGEEAHAKWSAEFLSQYLSDEVVDLALNHHNHGESAFPDLADMIFKADYHSSSGLNSNETNKSSSPLISIFSEIQINDNKKSEEHYVPLEKINLGKTSFENLKPKLSSEMNEDLKADYKRLYNEFTDELNGLNRFDFNTVLALMKKYTSTMPYSDNVSLRDISLFDHSKVTTALAVCRYLFDRDSEEKLDETDSQKVYLAVNGDISGIQKFIFKISSPEDAQSGMSKRLRGRSLYLTLLTNAIADAIIKDLELSNSNILFCGGGRFTIIAPNTDVAKSKIKQIKEKVNEEFIEKFNAELYLAISTEEASGDDLADFGKITSKLAQKTNDDKKHKFIENISELFTIDEDLSGQTICAVCGNLYPKEEKERNKRCGSCLSHERLGQDVSNADYMVKCLFNEKVPYENRGRLSFYDDVLDIAYIFIERKDAVKTSKDVRDIIELYGDIADNFEIIKLNDSDFLNLENDLNEEEREKVSFSFSFIGNVVPKYSKRIPLYFEHLAQISDGANKLGVLKMDVDNLGLIFSTGFNHLKTDENTGNSITRISTLSSQLDMFFSGFINTLSSQYKVYHEDILNKNIVEKDMIDRKFRKINLKLQNEEDKSINVYKLKAYEDLDEVSADNLKDYEIPTIHINYSGGDDLLVLGPYDDTIKFGKDLRDKFKEWTCDNNSINLSAGINIVSAKFPIGKAVDMAENYLEKSKSCGKDKITIFNETVSWNKSSSAGFDELLEFSEDLEKYYLSKERGVSKSFIYSLLHMWQYSYTDKTKFINNEDDWIDNILLRKQTKKFVPVFKYRLRLIKNPSVRDDLDGKIIGYMPWIRIPVSWVSLRTR